MDRRAIWTANAALILLCCFLAAGVLRDVLAEWLLPPEASASLPAPAATPEPRSWQDRQVILERNLFNASTLAQKADVEVQEDLAQSKLPAELLGTVASEDPEFARAAVADKNTRQHLVVGIGDDLLGATVERIERRRIVLRNKGRLEELALDDESGAAARRAPATRGASARRAALPSRRNARSPRAAPARQNRAAAARIQRLAKDMEGVDPEEQKAMLQEAAGDLTLDRSAVAKAASNPAALFSQARILPKYEEGQMVGVQLNSIKDGSLFEQIGIQDGDIITELNGIEISSQQDTAEVLRELTESSAFNLTVTGDDGSSRQLTYQTE